MTIFSVFTQNFISNKVMGSRLIFGRNKKLPFLRQIFPVSFWNMLNMKF